MGAAARERGGGALGGERDGGLGLVAAREREGEPGGEAVAGAVGVRDRARAAPPACTPRRGSRPCPRCLLAASGRDDERGCGSRSPRLVPLARVAAAADERVELDAGLLQRRERARGRHEDARRRAARDASGVAADEVDGVASRELVPRQRVVAARHVLLADDRDRPLAALVHEGEPPALRLLGRAASTRTPSAGELRERRVAELVAPERGEEGAGAREPRELDRGHAASPGRLGPPLARLDDLAGDAARARPGRTPPTRRGRRRRFASTAVSHLGGAERFNG